MAVFATAVGTIPELGLASAQTAAERTFLPVRWTGRAVPMTPFDLKLMAAGFYGISGSPVPDRPVRTLEEIFAEAQTFRYQKDLDADTWQDPDQTERTRTGDCEDMALWLYRELRNSGYRRVRIMVGKFMAAERSYHTWITLPGVGGNDLIVDPALQTRIWKRSEILQEIYVPRYSFDGEKKYDHAAL